MRGFLIALFVTIGAYITTTGSLTAQRGGPPAGPPPSPSAIRSNNNQFAGIWKLVSQEQRDAKGQVIPPTPPAAANAEGRLGFIVYDPAGYMAVAIQQGGRQKFAGQQPTPDEARAALGSYTSYWGSFSVNQANSIVTHQTFGAISTAMSGTDQVRGFTFSGNRLTLRPPVGASGNQASLTWERVPDLPNLTPTHRKFIGFWNLISSESRNAKGEVISSNPGQTGFIIYTASGHMMVHMMQPYRRRNVGGQPTPEETLSTYRSYTSYFGPYTVNESEKYVVHHLIGTTNPGSVGRDNQRFYEFSGKRLILKPPVNKTANGETQSTITWERISD